MADQARDGGGFDVGVDAHKEDVATTGGTKEVLVGEVATHPAGGEGGAFDEADAGVGEGFDKEGCVVDGGVVEDDDFEFWVVAGDDCLEATCHGVGFVSGGDADGDAGEFVGGEGFCAGGVDFVADAGDGEALKEENCHTSGRDEED